jgi:hypothetical protein
LTGGLGHALDVERVDGKIGMSWMLALEKLANLGRKWEGLGAWKFGGTRAEHWPKNKEYLPRQHSHIVICEGSINTTSKEQLFFMVLMIL